MAKVLFVMRYPLDGRDNLAAKFDGQMGAMRALGHEVRWLGWDARGVWLLGGAAPELLQRSRGASLPGYAHTLLCVDLMDALKNTVARERYDLLYMRFMPTFGNAVGAIAAAKKSGAKLILEHPTYPFQNGKTTSLLRKPVFWYTDRVFARINPMIDLYTLIGEPNDGTLCGRPAMNILNGVDAERFPLHCPRPNDPQIHLLALASMSRWQGYDRLIRAMAQSDADMVLHLAGGDCDGSLAEWKRLAEELGVSERVVLEGEKHGEALDALTERCDIGVGGLGLYRKRQYQSMTLKLREYMARGLPFVYAVDDPSIPDEPRFCLRVPNDDSLPDIEQIAAFAMCAKADAETPERMRDYAKAHMSWTSIWKPVLERVNITCQEP